MNEKWYQKSKAWPIESLSFYGPNPVCGIPKVSSFSNIDPNRILVDMGVRGSPLPKSDKNEISNFLGEVGRKYWDYIPLKEIFEKLNHHGIVPLQEDGTRWSGFLCGNKECGAPGSENQRANFRLAFRKPNGLWTLSSNCLVLLWCQMSVSKRYEIVTYVS